MAPFLTRFSGNKLPGYDHLSLRDQSFAIRQLELLRNRVGDPSPRKILRLENCKLALVAIYCQFDCDVCE
jgi:hypothetical protein